MPGPLEPLIFGYRTIFRGLVQLARRAGITFDVNDFDIADDPVTGTTVVSLRGNDDGGGEPGGADRQYQFQNEGLFAGSANLINRAEDGGVTFSGASLHREGWVVFRDPGEPQSLELAPNYGEDRSGWSSHTSANATPFHLLTLAIPTDVFSDVVVTCTMNVTCAAAGATGGSMSIKFVARRTGGVLTIDPDEKLDTTTFAPTIAASIDATTDATDTLYLTATGIVGPVSWTSGAYVEIAVVPT